MSDWPDRIKDDQMRSDLYVAVQILARELAAGKTERKDRAVAHKLVRRYAPDWAHIHKRGTPGG